MSVIEDISEKIDVKKLLNEIYFAEEDVAKANINQAKLMFVVSRYRVQTMRKRLQLEAKLELKRAEYSLLYRRKLSGDKTPTEGSIKERVIPKIYPLVKELHQAEVDEELAKQLYECYKQRQIAIKNIFDARRNETARNLYDLEATAKHKKLRDAAKLARDKYREREEE